MRELQSLTYEEFTQDHILHASAERDFQVAIQAAIDIGSILLAASSSKTPQSYTDIFLSLADVGILPPDFAQKLVGMAKFRNVLVHMYVEVDLKKVYHYLQYNLEDFELFARYISEYLERRDKENE